MRAISVKYLGPTNTKPSRLMVRAAGGKARFFPFHDQSSTSEAERVRSVVAEYLMGLGWDGEWHGGSSDGGWVFVCHDPQYLVHVPRSLRGG